MQQSRSSAALATLAPAAITPAVFLLCYRWAPVWLFPVLVAAPLVPSFALAVRRGLAGPALLAALLWAASLCACATTVSMHRPQEAEAAIWNARAYAEKTLQWVRTGEGEEGSPSRFLPRHALELMAFAALAAATGGVAALVLGAALLNHMSFYVAALWRLSGGVSWALVLGWPPWALVRIVAYVALGTALAGVLLTRRLPPGSHRPPFARGLLIVGLAGVVLDVLLKAFLAAPWRQVLLRALGGPP